MKEVITDVDPANTCYKEKFNKIMADQRMTFQEVEKYPQETIIGQIIKGCFGDDSVLRLKVFLGTETEKKSYEETLFMVARNFSGNYELDIGSKNGELEIFQQKHDEERELYELLKKRKRPREWEEEKRRWVRVPEDFLKDTYGLLKDEYKPRFGMLNSSKDE